MVGTLESVESHPVRRLAQLLKKLDDEIRSCIDRLDRARESQLKTTPYWKWEQRGLVEGKPVPSGVLHDYWCEFTQQFSSLLGKTADLTADVCKAACGVGEHLRWGMRQSGRFETSLIMRLREMERGLRSDAQQFATNNWRNLGYPSYYDPAKGHNGHYKRDGYWQHWEWRWIDFKGAPGLPGLGLMTFTRLCEFLQSVALSSGKKRKKQEKQANEHETAIKRRAYERRKKAWELHKTGFTNSQIAGKLNVSESTISRDLNKPCPDEP